MTLAEFFMAHAGHGVKRWRLDLMRVRYSCARHRVLVIVQERRLPPDTLHGSSAEHLRSKGGES